uniref:Endonuclease/exonuclease/phosphatase domain-containing protein n=1 Tax=Latimeria chalumnae TaxID=7897 RepID=H2ZU16_LATCH
GGDFNQIMDQVLDRSKPLPKGSLQMDREALQALIMEYGLVDVWRLLNLSSLEYTFQSRVHGTSRIDMVLVSHAIVNSVQSCGIGVRALSDHAPVDMSFVWSVREGRRGRWRMNVSLLHSEPNRKEIGQYVHDYLENNVGSVESPATLWEAGKVTIRGRLLAMASRLQREGMQRAISLERKIRHLESQRDISQQHEVLQELVAMVRQQDMKRTVSAIRSTTGGVTTDPHQIRSAFLEFYKALYISGGGFSLETLRTFMEGIELPSLSEQSRQYLEAPINKGEVEAAIRNIHSRKSPGED